MTTAGTTVAPSRLLEGDTLRRGYEVIAHLRRGRDLDVYDVWSEDRDCRCVAKVLRPDRAQLPRPRRRLRQEGRLLLGIAHPHIVRAYELIERPNPILILETLDGATLEHLIESSGNRLSVPDLAYLGMHLCSAIQYMHRQGVLHLDVKPSNVISEHGQAKLIDLSLARPPGGRHRGLGTPLYMSPEQVLGEPLSPAADIWGIGAALFEAATGSRPFGDGVQVGLNGKRPVDQHPPRVAEHRRAPPALRAVIERCLNWSPQDRPEVMEVSAALDALVG
jgi:eukaryotic-like serine/threonine-protein kinase